MLGWVMNPTGAGFHPLLQPPNIQQPANSVQFENVKFSPGNVTFIAASKMFHESSGSDDDHEVKF
jgi:hypothetical protein